MRYYALKALELVATSVAVCIIAAGIVVASPFAVLAVAFGPKTWGISK